MNKLFALAVAVAATSPALAIGDPIDVPLPATVPLIGIGLLVWALLRRSK